MTCTHESIDWKAYPPQWLYENSQFYVPKWLLKEALE